VPRLEVAIGPDRFHTTVAWVNHTSRPTEINTPLFAGRVLVFVRDFAGVTPDGSPPKRDATYFEGRSRKFAILVEGKFKRREGVAPYGASEVQFGSDFGASLFTYKPETMRKAAGPDPRRRADYLPDSFPMGPFQAGMKVAQWIDPATHYEFRPPHGRPYIMSPWSACVNTFAAYPSPAALSRAVVLSHHDSDHPHVDGTAEEGTFVPTEAMNAKRKWVERPHWSFLGLKGDPRVDAFLQDHAELLPPSGTSTPSSSSLAPPTRPGMGQRPSSLVLGTSSAPRPGSEAADAPPARSDSPPFSADASAGGAGLWGAAIPRTDDTDSVHSGSSTPAKKKKFGKFSLSSLAHALDTSTKDDSSHDHVLMADQLLGAETIGRQRAQSDAGAYKPDPDVAKELGPWRFADESVDAAEVRRSCLPLSEQSER